MDDAELIVLVPRKCNNHTDRRTEAEATLGHNAVCIAGGTVILGGIYPLGPGRFFFAPEAAATNDAVCGDVCPWEHFSVGEQWELEIDTNPRRKLSCEVVWVGESEHCGKVGVELSVLRGQRGVIRLGYSVLPSARLPGD